MINKNYGLTVGDLLDFIEKHDLKRDAVVLTQRIEDRYFEGCDISGCGGYTNADGSYGVYPEASKASGWDVEVFPDLYHQGGTTEYFQAWCCVSRDKENLYIENHY